MLEKRKLRSAPQAAKRRLGVSLLPDFDLRLISPPEPPKPWDGEFYLEIPLG